MKTKLTQAEIQRRYRERHPGRNSENCRRWYYRHVERARRSALERYYQKTYGISLAEYEVLLIAQGGVCALCKRPPAGKRLAVDHSKCTGAVRALLCSQCNTGIGLLQENPVLLRLAAEYVEKEGQVYA